VEFGGNPVEPEQRSIADSGEQRLGLTSGEVWDGENLGHAHLLGFIPRRKDANTAYI
jgi:hypothetical protein